MTAAHSHDRDISFQVPGVCMWEVRGEAGWEAEVNSMCACIFIQRPQPAWILVGKMPLYHNSCILQFHLHTWGCTQMKARELKRRHTKRNAVVHDGSKEHICMQPYWHIKTDRSYIINIYRFHSPPHTENQHLPTCYHTHTHTELLFLLIHPCRDFTVLL